MLFTVDKIELSNTLPIGLISGPCVIETFEITYEIAAKLKQITTKLSIPFIFKSSFDKANRSSINSYRGPGLQEGLRILKEIKDSLAIPILTDVHETPQVAQVAEVVDVLQIPAFLCRQTDLIVECAKTGKPVNVKKAQFLTANDMKNVVTKLEQSGCTNYLLTERGSMFGYNNLVVDYRNIIDMKTFAPVCFDGTHSVQKPGGLGTASGGDRKYVIPLTKAAATLGIAAIFWEVHLNPDQALSDGPNMLPITEVESALSEILMIDRLVKNR